jgi:Adenylate kinase and related kinases
MTRVAVIGPGGAGKSSIASQLGEATRSRVVELDRLFWRPGWVETPAPEWEEIQRQELAQEPWIVDGLHDGTMHLWLEAADTIVFLDVSPLVATWRVSQAASFRGGSVDCARGLQARPRPPGADQVSPLSVGVPNKDSTRDPQDPGAAARPCRDRSPAHAPGGRRLLTPRGARSRG